MEKVINDLNKYERTRLLSARALQISENAPTYVKQTEKDNIYTTAIKEYDEGKIPLRVLRKNIKEDIKEFE
jgi:DNA-directed RNA polymerase subunit K/omega